mmetsp:Transcript_39226/g.117959  ORF Transcript_39226/g.117959 Transcript_39226/m.117959 type:complete len:120 (+) Transcript_39226:1372-1731(+)
MSGAGACGCGCCCFFFESASDVISFDGSGTMALIMDDAYLSLTLPSRLRRFDSHSPLFCLPPGQKVRLVVLVRYDTTSLSDQVAANCGSQVPTTSRLSARRSAPERSKANQSNECRIKM